MQSPTTPDTPENWSAASRGYAEQVAPRMMEAYADLDVDSTTEALEVAAGSGALTQVLAKRVKSLLATDFAPEMIAILRDRMRAEGADHVTCEVMDGQALTLDECERRPSPSESANDRLLAPKAGSSPFRSRDRNRGMMTERRSTFHSRIRWWAILDSNQEPMD